MSRSAPNNLVSEPMESKKTLENFIVMAKNKGKTIMAEPQKMQALGENMREVDQKLSNVRSKNVWISAASPSHYRPRLAMLNQQLERLTNLLQDNAQLGETAAKVSPFASVLNVDRGILPSLRRG